MDTTKLLSSRDGSKKFRRGAEFDYRTGNQDIGKLLSFAPYEKGYCFLAVMETPKIMRTTTNISDGDNEDSYRKLENDNRDRLLWTFVDILELEFMGLSGLEDQTLETNDISNNIQNASIVSKNNRSTYTNISMSFTEKSGTPITKFMERYTNYIYDPYSMAKTYGGRLRTDKLWIDEVNAGRAVSVNKRIDNECFTLLYVVTDSTCLLVEKAFILYRAQPLNVSYSQFDMNKFEVDKSEINLTWNCMVIDGALANKLGTAYVRKLMHSYYRGYDYTNYTKRQITSNVDYKNMRIITNDLKDIHKKNKI